MYVASDLAAIARNNGLQKVAGVDAAVGTSLSKGQLKSFTTLKSTDGVYYNKALNTLAITKSGVTFDGYDFRGVSINVQADNVTIKNSTFDASVGKYAINALTGTKNLTVDRSTFDGLKLDNIGYVDFIMSRGHNTVLTNNAFLDAPSTPSRSRAARSAAITSPADPTPRVRTPMRSGSARRSARSSSPTT